jgi:hypothetical protein
MATIVITHAVADTDHWLASPRREQVMPGYGISNIRTFVSPTDRNQVGLVLDVEDPDALVAALADPPPDFVEAMEYDTVRPETISFYFPG